MSTHRAQGRARFSFAVPAAVFLLFATLEVIDAIGFGMPSAEARVPVVHSLGAGVARLIPI